VDDSGARLDMPARISDEIKQKIQEIAVKAYKILYCQDYSRVDLFLKDNGEIYLNEINTIPGFTHISMFPQLWKLDGITYRELITQLIDTALKKYERQNRIKRDYDSAL
jgi:D-alanine-D-alanine ligase